MKLYELPTIENKDLYEALDKSYSLPDMFGVHPAPKAQPIRQPVEWNGNYYVSLGGRCIVSVMREERGCEWMSYGNRLIKPEEYTGQIYTGMEYAWDVPSLVDFFQGMLVVDPDGNEWVVGPLEIRAMWFEPRDEKPVSAVLDDADDQPVEMRGQLTLL